MMRPEHDGRRFRFPGGGPLPSGLDALRWALTRRPARWPRGLGNPPPDPIPPRVDAEALRVTFVNHATVLLQLGGANILTDPVFSRRVSPLRFAGPARHRPPGLALDALPAIDAVLLSHSHYDHLDAPSIERLHRAHAPTVLAPLNTRSAVPRRARAAVVELDWWQGHRLSDALEITLVPARHWTSRRPGDVNRRLWGGFAIRHAAGAVYFAGDTGYGDGRHFAEAREACGPFRLALLPIGAYAPRWFMRPQHMNPAEAVRAMDDLAARHALGIHFGTFRLTDEPHDEPEAALAEALARERVDPARFRTLGNGQGWDVPAA